MQITETMSAAPAIIDVQGKTKYERQMYVVAQASTVTLAALCDAKGKMGNAVRDAFSRDGLRGVARAAAWPTVNYRPMGEYLAARLGEPVVISNRASFNALPDMLESRIMKVKLSKSYGMTTDKKTGALKPNATLSLLMRLKSECVDAIELADKLSTKAKAKQADQQAITA
jgi:hypothetical protein